MRVSDWVNQFRISVKPCESRADNPAGDVVYRVKEIFTTRDGSWEPSDTFGSIPQWARDSYIRPWGAPDYFDDAGGDHHLFARVLDQGGQPVKSNDLVRYWSDGFSKLGDPGYQKYERKTPKAGSGWANLDIYQAYYPESGQIGTWCWCPEGASDVVVGGGMPQGNHISTFVIWQAEARGTGGQPLNLTVNDDAIRSAVWGQAGITFSNSSSLADYARRNNLGAPITNETDTGGFVAQGYASAIVYAPRGQWHNISHISW